jgi:hypothetical protein
MMIKRIAARVTLAGNSTAALDLLLLQVEPESIFLIGKEIIKVVFKITLRIVPLITYSLLNTGHLTPSTNVARSTIVGWSPSARVPLARVAKNGTLTGMLKNVSRIAH